MVIHSLRLRQPMAAPRPNTSDKTPWLLLIIVGCNPKASPMHVVGLVALGIYGLNQATAPLMQLYAVEFSSRNPDWQFGAAIIVALMVLAMSSAGLAVRRTLRSMAR